MAFIRCYDKSGSEKSPGEPCNITMVTQKEKENIIMRNKLRAFFHKGSRYDITYSPFQVIHEKNGNNAQFQRKNEICKNVLLAASMFYAAIMIVFSQIIVLTLRSGFISHAIFFMIHLKLYEDSK